MWQCGRALCECMDVKSPIRVSVAQLEIKCGALDQGHCFQGLTLKSEEADESMCIDSTAAKIRKLTL